jgi:hypothetical protein
VISRCAASELPSTLYHGADLRGLPSPGLHGLAHRPAHPGTTLERLTEESRRGGEQGTGAIHCARSRSQVSRLISPMRLRRWPDLIDHALIRATGRLASYDGDGDHDACERPVADRPGGRPGRASQHGSEPSGSGRVVAPCPPLAAIQGPRLAGCVSEPARAHLGTPCPMDSWQGDGQRLPTRFSVEGRPTMDRAPVRRG